MTGKDIKFHLFMLLFLVFIIILLTLANQHPQTLINFAKESQVSEQSAQITQKPQPQTIPKIDNKAIRQQLVTIATDINNTTYSLIHEIAGFIIAGCIFTFLFYLLTKRFLSSL